MSSPFFSGTGPDDMGMTLLITVILSPSQDWQGGCPKTAKVQFKEIGLYSSAPHDGLPRPAESSISFRLDWPVLHAGAFLIARDLSQIDITVK
jgi:hypothetical protein